MSLYQEIERILYKELYRLSFSTTSEYSGRKPLGHLLSEHVSTFVLTDVRIFCRNQSVWLLGNNSYIMRYSVRHTSCDESQRVNVLKELQK